jgi:hypothetical protein
MAEPFDWMVAKRNPAVARGQQERRAAMYRTELEERAALLHRLGHPKDGTRARLQANARWDFPDGHEPVTPAQIDAIVDRVYGAGPTGKPGARPKAAR